MVSSSAVLLVWCDSFFCDYAISLEWCVKIYCFANQADLKYLKQNYPTRKWGAGGGGGGEMARNFLFKCFHQRNCVWLHVCRGEYENVWTWIWELLYITTKDKEQTCSFIPATMFQRKFLKIIYLNELRIWNVCPVHFLCNQNQVYCLILLQLLCARILIFQKPWSMLHSTHRLDCALGWNNLSSKVARAYRMKQGLQEKQP